MATSVVVTGCGKGIGRAIALRLAQDGYYVVGLEMDDASATEVSGHLADRGEVHVGDAAVLDALDHAAALAVRTAPLGAWVNNAGLAISGTLHSPNATEVERLFSVNLMGYFWGSSVAVRQFLAQRSPGAIVNVSSIHARSAFPGWAAYDTAKGGVDALTRYIAVEYGVAGIRANAISPGAIRTPLMQGVLDESPDPEASERDFGALHPLARLGEPEEIASAAAFLISEEASFITGENIAVDGGATARCYAFPTDAELHPPLDAS